MGPTLDRLRQLTSEMHFAIRFKKGLAGWQLEIDPAEGDCDSFAISLAVRLQRLGLDPWLLTHRTWKGEDHCIVRVLVGETYWFADAVTNRVTDQRPAEEFQLYPSATWHLLKTAARRATASCT